MTTIAEEAHFLVNQISYTNISHDRFLLVHGGFVTSFDDKSYLYTLIDELRKIDFFEPLLIKDNKGFYYDVSYTLTTVDINSSSGPYPDVDFRTIKQEEDKLRRKYHTIEYVDTTTNNLMLISPDMIPMIRGNYNRATYDRNYALFAERCNNQRLTAPLQDPLNDLSIFIPSELEDSLVIAGGFVVNNILGLTADQHLDIDIFIVSESPMFVLETYISWIKATHNCLLAKRNSKVITLVLDLQGKTIPLQIMLRAYKSPEQIIVGFDIDACSVCYYNNNYYATKRGFFALNNRINHVDVDRISPSYEHRLSKYAINKGFYVRQPLFSRELSDNHLAMFSSIHGSKFTECPRAGGSGFIKLLHLENWFTLQTTKQIKPKVSDYDDILHIPKLPELFGREISRTNNKFLVCFWTCYITNDLDLLLNCEKLNKSCSVTQTPQFITDNPHNQGFYDMATSSWTPSQYKIL